MAEEKPNVVVVLADDLGWNSLGSFGSDYYESPNIDRLAAQGMRFDNGYADCPICAPTRASLMSGWEIPRHKVLRVSDGQRKKSQGSASPRRCNSQSTRCSSSRQGRSSSSRWI